MSNERMIIDLQPNELIIDNFAGGGGASLGIEQALGRYIDIAINHDAEALAMHTANHPHTRHFIESVWDVDPKKVCAGRPVGLAWFSPDCSHHSIARGSKPVDKKIRGLAWVVVRWARAVKPRVVALENVTEFSGWTNVIHAVDTDGKPRYHKDGKPVMVPNPKRIGQTFRRWKRELEKLGYKVEHRELKAHEYGAPTIRKRLFIIARCDGQPIRWPDQTHGPGKLPYRTAAECIDFSIPAPSIFERKRSLAEGTMRRVAKGLKRYVLEAKEPFIVRTGHYIVGAGGPARAGEPRPVNAPMNTLLAKSDQRLMVPFLAGVGGRAGQSRPRGLN